LPPSAFEDMLADGRPPAVDAPPVTTAPLPLIADPAADRAPEDDVFQLPERRRLGASTVGLLVLLLLAAGFVGGALVQKHEGTSTVATGRAGRLAGAGGFARGEGAAGFGGAAGGVAGAAPAADAPVVVGTVVSVTGDTLIVKNLGGVTITVHLGSGVTVTRSSTEDASHLTADTTVSVAGTTGADGSVTATGITARSAG